MDSIELFSGTGGLALGLQKAGFHHKALYEWDSDSCNNIQYNINNGMAGIQDWQVFESDVRLVHFDCYTNKIQLVAGGPPCQPFSLGGKHRANNDSRDMFPEAVRAVREIKPKVFIFENVRGLLRKSFSEYYNYILLQLQYPEITKLPNMSWEEHLTILKQHQNGSSHQGELTYHVTYRLVNAADYGVPQSRYRVFIVGFRGDLNTKWVCPSPTHSKEALLYSKWVSNEYWDIYGISPTTPCPLSNDKLSHIKHLVENKLVPTGRWATVRDAIGDLPNPEKDYDHNIYLNHDFRPGAKSYPGHSGSSLDEPSKTIKAGTHGVPGGENTVILDDKTIRYYTVRESARIQTFPDDYCFSASWTESMRQIGNAVPVKLATAIGSSVFSQLKEMI